MIPISQNDDEKISSFLPISQEESESQSPLLLIPDPLSHPILQRHYSTIGIGNVFVCMNPNDSSVRSLSSSSSSSPSLPRHHHYSDKWILPSDYLSTTSSKSDEDGNHDTGTLLLSSPTTIDTTETTTTETTVLLSSSSSSQIIIIMGDEMIGQMKCQPEDFIVHEIAIVQGKIQTANTNKTDCMKSSTGCITSCGTSVAFEVASVEEEEEAAASHMDTTMIDQQPTATTVIRSNHAGNNNNSHTNHNNDIIEIETSMDVPTTNITTVKANTSQNQSKQILENKQEVNQYLSQEDSIHRLQLLLQKHLIQTSTINCEHGNQNNRGDSNNTMHLLHDMEEQAIQRIRTLHTEYKYNAVTDTVPPMSSSLNSVVVEVTLSYPNSNDTTDHYDVKQYKSNLHEYFRRACPLLVAESCKNHNNDSRGSNSNSRKNVDENASVIENNNNNIDMDHDERNQYSIRIMIDTTFDGLIPYLYAPVEDLPPLYQYAKNGYHHDNDETIKMAKQHGHRYGKGSRFPSRSRDGNSNDHNKSYQPILRILPNLPRTYRRPIHQLIDQKSNSLLGTETINDYVLILPEDHPENNNNSNNNSNQVEQLPQQATTTAIRISWTKMAARRASKKRQREEISDSVGSQQQQQQPNRLITKMLCVVKKRQREHLGMIHTLSAILKCRPADIGFAGMKDLQAITYQFGTLNGTAVQRYQNDPSVRDVLFQRGIEIVPLHPVPEPLNKGDLIGNHFEIVLRNLRRVQLHYKLNTKTDSNTSVSRVDAPSSTIHEEFVAVDDIHLQCMMNRVRTYGFINYYGEQRVGDPGHISLVGVRAFDIGRAMLQQKYDEAIDLLMTGRRMINGIDLVENNDVELFRQVWKETSGNAIATTKALPSGINSVPRERAVLKGLVRYGTDQPLTAFRCLPRNERLFFINAYQSYVWNMMATERMQRYGNRIVVGDLVLHDKEASSKPILVTELDLLDKSKADVFNMLNVVLPMPGYDTIYPTNDIGMLYQSFLQNEEVRFDKHVANDEAKARGSYRRLITQVINLTYERISSSTPTSTNNAVDIQLTFNLPKGSYATMFLRELMLKTVARDTPKYTTS